MNHFLILSMLRYNVPPMTEVRSTCYHQVVIVWSYIIILKWCIYITVHPLTTSSIRVGIWPFLLCIFITEENIWYVSRMNG